MYWQTAIFGSIVQLMAAKKLKSLQKTSDLTTNIGHTGKEVAEIILAENGMTNFKVVRAKKGKNHYDPSINTICLSPDIYDEVSVADAAISAHETGHAIQDAFLDKWVWFIAPLKIIGFISVLLSLLALPCLFFWEVGPLIQIGAIVNFSCTSLTMLSLLFIELDASVKAYRNLVNLSLITSKKEKKDVVVVLGVAYATYVFGFVASIGYLLWMLN